MGRLQTKAWPPSILSIFGPTHSFSLSLSGDPAGCGGGEAK
jgi:hypothetical protein